MFLFSKKQRYKEKVIYETYWWKYCNEVDVFSGRVVVKYKWNFIFLCLLLMMLYDMLDVIEFRKMLNYCFFCVNHIYFFCILQKNM